MALHMPGLGALPLPESHCRRFREGRCTRSPCPDLHVTCPDGRDCRDAQCILGHSLHHPRALEPLPDEVCTDQVANK